MADTPFFSVGGLASGLDTQSIVDGLTKLEQKPLDTLRANQAGFKTQISLIGTVVSQINALQTAAKNIAGANKDYLVFEVPAGLTTGTITISGSVTQTYVDAAGSYKESVPTAVTLPFSLPAG